MNMTSLMAFALALFVAAGSPGPSIAALVARVLTNSLREASALSRGHVDQPGDLAHRRRGRTGRIGALVAVGFLVIKLLGIGYLLFLAYKMWTTAPQATGGWPSARH